MIIRAGYTIAFECPAPITLLLQLHVHPSRSNDVKSPDQIGFSPHVPSRAYLDQFGNVVTRASVPAGTITLTNDFTIYDSGTVEESLPMNAAVGDVSRLPDDVLVYLLPSRYCDADNLGVFAWNTFGHLSKTSAVLQAICDFVHKHIRFDYQLARNTRTASQGFYEQVGVCRDYAHLAIALCRCMNIPARYCTGYLGDFGVPVDPNPMDFSAWCEAYIDGRWFSFDARHNIPRIGRVLMARGRDAADVALSTAFGVANLMKFEVVSVEELALSATG